MIETTFVAVQAGVNVADEGSTETDTDGGQMASGEHRRFSSNLQQSLRHVRRQTAPDIRRTSMMMHNERSAVKRKEKISVAKEKKAAKTLAVIMGVFVSYQSLIYYHLLYFIPNTILISR